MADDRIAPPPMVPTLMARTAAFLKAGKTITQFHHMITSAYHNGWDAAQSRIAELEAELAAAREQIAALTESCRRETEATQPPPVMVDQRIAAARTAAVTEVDQKAARRLWERLHRYDPIDAIHEDWDGVHPRLKAELNYIEAALAAARAEGRRDGIEVAAKAVESLWEYEDIRDG